MQRPLRLLFIYFSFVASTWSARPILPPPASAHCQLLLNDIQSHLSDLGFSDPLEIALNLAENKPSIELSATSVDANGQTLLHFQKVTSDWLSQARSNQYDPQGDPRWFLEILGLEASKQLGFSLRGPTEMTLPSLEAFNFYVNRLSEGMQNLARPAKLEISYYKQTTGTLKEYLKNFIENSRLPLATESLNHYLHDVNFHTAYLFVPKTVNDYSRELMRYSLYKNELVLEQLKLNLEEKRRLAYFLRLETTERIDLATASYTVAMNKYNVAQRGRSDTRGSRTHMLFERALRVSTGENKEQPLTPNQYAEDVFKAALVQYRNELKSPDTPPANRETLAYLSRLHESELALIQVQENYSALLLPSFRPNRPSGIDYQTQCQQLTQLRKDAIQTALSFE